ncbi:hypothetical protein DFH94DRAFT_678459 [Russula ochroleuca]|uniref:Uncharacterized protein n=1 Tax=Russula ochroleuca TaxID=152965 RepID=A0A9P5N6Z2_9AGAM|nr:hypothetical protein DFH94DRAFT_678459 [Russula ochroleuca]
MLNNDNLLAKAQSETAFWVAELETNLAHYTHLQEQTKHELQTAACQKQDAHTHVSTISTQLDCLRSMQSPALTCNDLDDSMNDSYVVELEWARACMGIDNAQAHVLMMSAHARAWMSTMSACLFMIKARTWLSITRGHMHSQEHVVHLQTGGGFAGLYGSVGEGTQCQ